MSRRVVIVGAGITGSLLAVRLARAGWSVVVLEGAHVGAGSSSRTAAGIRQQFSTPETVVGMRYSVDFYRRFREEVGGEDVPIVENGYLFLYALQEDWDAAKVRVRMQRACGLEEVEALEHAALAERFPWVDPHAVLGATWCPSDGFLHPQTVYNEAIAAAVRLGVQLVQGAPVTGPCSDRSPRPSGSRWRRPVATSGRSTSSAGACRWTRSGWIGRSCTGRGW